MKSHKVLDLISDSQSQVYSETGWDRAGCRPRSTAPVLQALLPGHLGMM